MQKLQLSIPEPCHESWQQMTPTEQGRFCNACAKEVIDFSTMTDIQVLNYFTNKTNEKVCGRALPEQLDKVISRPEHPKKKIFWYWNYIAMFLIFFTKGNAAKAQGGIKPATELNPVNIRGGMIAFDPGKDQGSHIVTGKVSDQNGNPVSFASVYIKGAKYGVAADAKGEFKINTEPNNILSISATGYKTAEIEVGKITAENIVLESERGFALGGEIVVQSYVDGVYQYPSNQNLVASLAIKDWETSLAIAHAKISINKNFSNNADIVFPDNSGKYKIEEIKSRDKYHVKIEADGYEPNEFTIYGSDFKDRKKEWEVLLKKLKVEPDKKTLKGKIGKETAGTMRCENGIEVGSSALYIIDGVIMTSANDINPDDIDDIAVLQGPAASALFGPDAANGAIVITTRKAKEKKLDTVTVTANPVQDGITKVTTCSKSVMGSMVSGVIVRSGNVITDSLRIITSKITGSVRIYPNPVQRGQEFSIALKLREAGLYQIQITDAAGRIVLQKQINANAKEVIEKIMTDGGWSAGIYYVSIINNKNQVTGKTSFIFK